MIVSTDIFLIFLLPLRLFLFLLFHFDTVTCDSGWIQTLRSGSWPWTPDLPASLLGAQIAGVWYRIQLWFQDAGI